MARVQMMALKRLTYGTRRLRAGEYFDARRQDVRVLSAVRLAAIVASVPALPAAPRAEPPVVEALPVAAAEASTEPADTTEQLAEPEDIAAAEPDELTALREAYEQRFGRRPDMRWGVARLREALDAED